MDPISRIEEAVENFLGERVKKLGPMSATEYFTQRETRRRDERARDISNNVGYINGHISALLTHISAMIAALGITLIVFEDSALTQTFILVEMAGYAVLALTCVYCLRHRGGFSPLRNNSNDMLGDYYNHYLKRRYIYIFCSSGVIIITLLFLITILGHAVMLFLNWLSNFGS
ncbi:MAG: hypothetical protein ACR2RA_06620 [Geminicoccaceae bacterium]